MLLVQGVVLGGAREDDVVDVVGGGARKGVVDVVAAVAVALLRRCFVTVPGEGICSLATAACATTATAPAT